LFSLGGKLRLLDDLLRLCCTNRLMAEGPLSLGRLILRPL
jgi:hypothetical protein